MQACILTYFFASLGTSKWSQRNPHVHTSLGHQCLTDRNYIPPVSRKCYSLFSSSFHGLLVTSPSATQPHHWLPSTFGHKSASFLSATNSRPLVISETLLKPSAIYSALHLALISSMSPQIGSLLMLICCLTYNSLFSLQS